ncbi:MFS transporter [Alicyclobacillus sp. SO9]|nr:MFS transporter [Alicyclobacillus sp. SO9]
MVTIAMMVAVLLVAIDVTVVSTAMPRIVADLSGINLFSWVFAIYTLTTSVTTPIYGKLADLYGRKIVFTVGVIIFLVGSMLSGLSQTMMQLIFFRALQGIGAGAVMPITFTIIGDLFSGEERGRMQGLFSSVWGIAGILGPLLGGFFVDYGSWRWIFYINVPIGIISLTLVWMYLHETFERRQHKVDYLGAALFTVSISSLLYALLNGGKPHYAWTSPTVFGLFAAAVLGLILFFVVESRAREPILPLSLFKMRIIAVSNLASFLASAVLIATQVYLPMWIQSILGHSATSSGLTLMPMSIGWPLAATIGGRLMYKAGSKLTAVLGGVLITVGCLWLATMGVAAPYWYLIAIMVIIGLGMGFSMTPFTVLIQASVPWRMRGAATASNTFMRTLGQTMGVAIYGTWFNHSVSHFVKAQFGAAGPPKQFDRLLSPGAVHVHVSTSVIHEVQGILSHSLHTVFLVVGVTAIMTLASILLLPLHKTVMQQQVQE